MLLTNLVRSNISFVSESPQIFLIFGVYKREIMIHKDVLQRVPFFSDALQNVKPDNGAIQLDYSEHSRAVGEWLAHWLYIQKTPYTASDIANLKEDEQYKVGWDLVKAYRLASRSKTEEWANHLTDIFMEFEPELPHGELYDFLVWTEEDTDKLKSLMLTMLAGAIRVKGWDLYTSSVDKDFVGEMREDSDFAVKLAEHLAKGFGLHWSMSR